MARSLFPLNSHPMRILLSLAALAVLTFFGSRVSRECEQLRGFAYLLTVPCGRKHLGFH